MCVLKQLCHIAHIWGLAFTLYVCADIFVHSLLIALDMPLFIHFPFLTLCVRRQTDSTGSLLWEQNLQLRQEPKPRRAHYHYGAYCTLKDRREHICWFLSFHAVRSGHRASLSLLPPGKKILGFCFGLMITGVYLGKLEATKPIRP